MYPTFTGSAKARRQVNLSGRTSNPFATYGASVPSTTIQTAHNAVAHAQSERWRREQERRRPPAAAKIQRVWRGHSSRTRCRQVWREEWDAKEQNAVKAADPLPYKDNAEFLDQMRHLAQFVTSRSDEDIRRIIHFGSRCRRNVQESLLTPPPAWKYPAFRIASVLVQRMRQPRLKDLSSNDIEILTFLLSFLAQLSSHLLGQDSENYYRAVINIARIKRDLNSIRPLALALLQGPNKNLTHEYEGFAWVYLTQAHLPGFENDVDGLAQHIHYEHLSAALAASLPKKSNEQLLQVNGKKDGLLWLLSYFIYFHQHPRQSERRTSQPDTQYVQVVSRLISGLADDIGRRIDSFDMRSFSGSLTPQRPNDTSETPLPDFVRSQILSLVDQRNVTGLLSKIESDRSSDSESTRSSDEASALASYVLTLMRVFPKRRNDIQMWLFRGSATNSSSPEEKTPATKYLFQAARSTLIYEKVKGNARNAVHFLAATKAHKVNGKVEGKPPNNYDQQWRITLLFLELYSFILQVIDDEEFLSGNSKPDPKASWTKQSALPLGDVASLSVFLKNLAFALYWYASEIAHQEEKPAAQGLAAYFGKVDYISEEEEDSIAARGDEREFAGVSGMTISSLKGLVVGVLRMIYQRDSRRSFLPPKHWLMTEYFEMDRFIPAVVKEEEHNQQIQSSYENDNEGASTSEPRGNSGTQAANEDFEAALIGTRRTQQIQGNERLRELQRTAAKRKYLESVTPRLQILQNMPFFIPFHTRVEIFRQFVELDQIQRRGTSDPDEWRYAQMNSATGNIGRHRATVRREHIFDDAYKQYYELGAGLKEPIQIRFVDKFDTVEEGIDGGGVTKEFLTSVTNEAFGAANGLEALFAENEQHLLYPNPTAVEEREEHLRQVGFKEKSHNWNDVIRDLLRRYQFLGRLIGKCLYEGILIDIHFAPFFLLKWALTGGSGAGARESGYRANLNDLRDLDEGLYQGLLQLKNYSGNVQEDFSLDFTVTDTLKLSPTQTKSITKDLRPNGSNIPVTNENRLVYIAAVARHRLQSQPFSQTSSFLKGLGEIVSPGWLSMFNQSELQTLIGGSGAEVSIADLRANTQYGGVYALGDDGLEHPSIQLFWKVLQKMTPEEVANVLKFVTSTPRAPLLGFANLNPKFSIRDSGRDQTRLPSTSTCVNLLKLPIYNDEKVLREKLLYSVNAGAGFNLS